MTDAEIFPFMATLRDVIRIFPVRGEETDIQQLGASYFKALRRYPLASVQAGAERVIAHHKHFPKPAEWLDVIPRAATAATVQELSVEDRDDWLAAERGRWEQAPCRDLECQIAGVTETPQRFVPMVDADGRDVRASIGDRIVTRGSWIHGGELARWHAAKDRFWALFAAAVRTKAMYVPPSGAPGTPREPGEEG